MRRRPAPQAVGDDLDFEERLGRHLAPIINQGSTIAFERISMTKL
jgi:hypothetical protein